MTTAYQELAEISSNKFIKKLLKVGQSRAHQVMSGSRIPTTERGKRLEKERVLKFLYHARSRIDEMIKREESK